MGEPLNLESYWDEIRPRTPKPRVFERRVDHLAEERLRHKRPPEEHPELSPMKFTHPILPCVVIGYCETNGYPHPKPSFWVWEFIARGDQYGDQKILERKVSIYGLSSNDLQNKLKQELNELIRTNAVQMLTQLLSEGFGNLDERFRP